MPQTAGIVGLSLFPLANICRYLLYFGNVTICSAQNSDTFDCSYIESSVSLHFKAPFA